MATGTVSALFRWPVKSLGGEEAPALRVDRRGVAGDRGHALQDMHKGAPRRLTAREAPRMLLWTAAYPDHPGDELPPGALPGPVLTAPDGRTFAWSDPELPAALSADLGRDVTLRSDAALMPDLPDSILVTTQASLDAVRAQFPRQPLDLRRFRTNIHLTLDAEPYAEERWAGRRLRIGTTELELLHPCTRCAIPTRDPETTTKFPELLRWLTAEHGGLFGINARATGPGRVAVGDRAELL